MVLKKYGEKKSETSEREHSISDHLTIQSQLCVLIRHGGSIQAELAQCCVFGHYEEHNPTIMNSTCYIRAGSLKSASQFPKFNPNWTVHPATSDVS